MSLQQIDARRERLREEKAEARRLGVSVRARTVIDRNWTEAEDETVHRLYPDYQAMTDVLRHRTYDSLRGRAKTLRIATNKHIWTNTECARLKSIWLKSSPADLRAAFPGMSYGAIYSYGIFLGLAPRGKPPFKLTGHWLCDAIRDRCRELGYSMAQLDELAQTGQYFHTQAWHSKSGHKWWPMVRAAKTLGGELRVEWPD